ncbi:MAG: Glu-tRNA(Gln) amidotransferase subunit GatD [Candidatus Poseidoniaceae archaeon]
MDANQGDRVRVELETEGGPTVLEGRVLPAAAAKHLTLKLVNGYNVSHRLDRITNLEVLEASTPHASAQTSSSGDDEDDLPHVHVIHTGGTIASKVDYATGAVTASFEPEELRANVPELAGLAKLTTTKLGNMFSDDVRPQHWNKMAASCAEAFASGARGVVITHGTDTLHHSAAALAFAFAGQGTRPAGPIVFVGSQRSSDRGSSDAAENLIAAVHWAAHGPRPTGSLGDATVIVMHASSDDGTCAVLPGVAARKMHSTRRDAFRALNGAPIAHVDVGHDGCQHRLSEAYEGGAKAMEPRPVATSPSPYRSDLNLPQLTANAWLRAEHIEALAATGPSAIILHGTGLGHLPMSDPEGDAPENKDIWKALMRASNRKMPVIVTTQCLEGPVDMNVYAKGREQQDLGILGHGLTCHADTVAVKTHYLISADLDLAEHLHADLCGENPPRL